MITKVTGKITWEGSVAQEQHRRELIAATARQSLVRSVSGNKTTFYQFLLAQLGEQLVEWGYRLQAPYGTFAESIDRVETLCQQRDGSRCQYANIQV